jgi:hypothetical protein
MRYDWLVGAQRFREALLPLTLAYATAAGACGLVVGDLPEPATNPIAAGTSGVGAGTSGAGGDAGHGGSSGESGSAGQVGSAGDSGSAGSVGSSGQSGSDGQGGSGATGQGGTLGDGAGGTAGDASAGTNGASGTAGANGASGTAGTAGGTSGTAGTAGQQGTGGACANPCDCDRDGVRAATCSGGTDCDDADANVFPGQMDWFERARSGGSFDYNCSTRVEREFEAAVSCMGLLSAVLCNQTAQGFYAPPPCGQMGAWGGCRYENLSCKQSVLDQRTMRCH